MSHPSAQLLYWSPRILGIAYAAFISIFALDVFNEAQGFLPTLAALAIHLIPTFIMVAVVIVAWRWEWIGAGIFTALAVTYAWNVLPQHMVWALGIAAPLLLIAALFFANWIEQPKIRAAL